MFAPRPAGVGNPLSLATRCLSSFSGIVTSLQTQLDVQLIALIIGTVCGAVAQLAERRVRNAEARSSTLLCSTTYPAKFNHLHLHNNLRFFHMCPSRRGERKSASEGFNFLWKFSKTPGNLWL